MMKFFMAALVARSARAAVAGEDYGRLGDGPPFPRNRYNCSTLAKEGPRPARTRLRGKRDARTR